MSDNSAASRWLMERALEDLEGVATVDQSPQADERLSDMMVAETIFALRREDSACSHDWYTKAIARMISVLSVMHPEIGNDEAAAAHPSGIFKNCDEARTVLFAAMAITSQNINVFDNMRYALEQYRAFLEQGSFAPKGYGANGGAIESNLARFNFILDRAGGDLTRVKRLLTMEFRMGDLQKTALKYGISIDNKELADERVYGSMLFGPKVGNGFFQNLMGNHKPVTIDLWFMRLWGRYTGTLIRDEVTGDSQRRLAAGLRRSLRSERMTALLEKEGLVRKPTEIMEMDASQLLDYAKRMRRFWERLRKKYVEGTLSEAYTTRSGKRSAMHIRDNAAVSEFKAKLLWPGAAESIVKSLGMPQDSPRNGRMRKWIRDVVSMSLDKLERKGISMTAADLQAILWYPEKEIYGRLTGRPSERLNMSYDEAVAKIALTEGHSVDEIARALDTFSTREVLRPTMVAA